MTLSRLDVENQLESGQLEIIREEGDLHVGPSSVDLHLYPKLLRAFRPPDNTVVVDDEETYPEWYDDGTMRVGPGEFVLASTAEYVRLPACLMGYVDGRSSVGRLGLATENAGLIDGGFEGQITLELKNQQDYAIELVPDMRIAQLTIHEHDTEPILDYSNQGKYQGQEGPTPSQLYEDFQ